MFKLIWFTNNINFKISCICIMNIDNFILICMFIIIIIIFLKTVNGKPLYEGLDPTIGTGQLSTESISNIASVYNNEKMIMSNLDVTKNLNVTGVTNVNDINVGNIITPAGKVDIAPSNELNEDGKNGCYYEPIKFRIPGTENLINSWPDSYANDNKPERGYIKDASCKRGYYVAGFKTIVSDSFTVGASKASFSRSYNLVCCPFITK